MKLSSLSLPHPVLGVKDDVNGYIFEAKTPYPMGTDEIVIEIEYVLDNPTLINLIKENKAGFCSELNCASTFYRNSFITYDKSTVIKIPSKLLRNRVEVEIYIVATENIEKYQIIGAHEDYKGYEFEIQKGDILAAGGTFSFIAAKDWESLIGVRSFMNINHYEEETGPMKVILTDSKLEVMLCKKDYDKYATSKNLDAGPVFHSAIVLPVLVYALTEMIVNRENHEDSDWFQFLEDRKKNDEILNNYDWNKTRDIPLIAQEILKNPLERTLNSVDKLLSSQNEQ